MVSHFKYSQASSVSIQMGSAVMRLSEQSDSNETILFTDLLQASSAEIWWRYRFLGDTSERVTGKVYSRKTLFKKKSKSKSLGLKLQKVNF